MENSRIIMTAYAIHPKKGSEDGTAWNLVNQVAKTHLVSVITRKNNKPPIDLFLKENPESSMKKVNFQYFDLPWFLRFWKKGPNLSLVYFWLWQASMPFVIIFRKIPYDILHNLNFHTDWMPTFLPFLKGPVVWGPAGHHPYIPKEYLISFYGYKHFLIDRLKGITKSIIRSISPVFSFASKKSQVLISINGDIPSKWKGENKNVIVMPAVAARKQGKRKHHPQKKGLNILSVGRFVPLKGFDMVLCSFAQFISTLKEADKKSSHLTIVGRGPTELSLRELSKDLGILNHVTFIPWIAQEKLFELYRASDLFFFPSHEGAGMVIPEALSFGLPCLVYDNNGPGKLIDSSCGIKIPYSNYQKSVLDFSRELKNLFFSPTLLTSLSKNAIRFHSQKMTWTSRGERLNNIYKNIG